MYDPYIDDVFVFVSKAKSVEFFERLNSLQPALRFTEEGEENGSLPFLDVRANTLGEITLSFATCSTVHHWRAGSEVALET